MKIRRRRLAALACALCLTLICPAHGTQAEQDAAGESLRQQGIMVGDQDGDLDLGSPLDRAELAVLLTRLKGVKTEDLLRSTSYYSMYCGFTDVPEWARPYVGYCAQHDLVAGYDPLHYGAADPVTPAAACTVTLRALGFADLEGSLWNYRTAPNYAAGLGWIDNAAAQGKAITRREMAVLICRAMTGARFGDPQLSGVGNRYLANGKPATEENVLEQLREIQEDWPGGSVWGRHTTPGTHRNQVPGTAAGLVMDRYRVDRVYGCSGYAAMVSSLIFGDSANPAWQLNDLTQIRPGDILFLIRNDTGKIWHVEVSLESPNEMNALHYTDGNHGAAVYWPDVNDPYSREDLNAYGVDKTYRVEVWTRYPENVPFTGESANAWGIPAP